MKNILKQLSKNERIEIKPNKLKNISKPWWAKRTIFTASKEILFECEHGNLHQHRNSSCGCKI